MAEGEAPAEHALAAREVERQPEDERPEETAEIAQRRMYRHGGAALAGQGAADRAGGEGGGIGPDQQRVAEAERGGERIGNGRGEADDAGDGARRQHDGQDADRKRTSL